MQNLYHKWSPGEPNDGYPQDCMILRREGTVHDENCAVKYPFICKKSLSSLKWNQFCSMPNIGLIIVYLFIIRINCVISPRTAFTPLYPCPHRRHYCILILHLKKLLGEQQIWPRTVKTRSYSSFYGALYLCAFVFLSKYNRGNKTDISEVIYPVF